MDQIQGRFAFNIGGGGRQASEEGVRLASSRHVSSFSTYITYLLCLSSRVGWRRSAPRLPVEPHHSEERERTIERRSLRSARSLSLSLSLFLSSPRVSRTDERTTAKKRGKGGSAKPTGRAAVSGAAREAALCRRRSPLARSPPRPAFPARAALEARAPVGLAGPDFLSGISPSIAELLPLARLPNHHWPPNPSLDSHWPPSLPPSPTTDATVEVDAACNFAVSDKND